MLPSPHLIPPLIMLVMTPYPGTRPAALSAGDGVHPPVITLWQEGFGGWAVVQNQSAVLKEMVGSVATKSGFPSKLAPVAFPAGP